MAELQEFAEDPGFEIVPADDEELTEEEELDNATEAALEDSYGQEEAEDPPVPYGRSWKWDRARGRFLRVGGSPVEVRGEESLYEWILNALHTAAGQHASLPADFGVEDPSGIIGEVDPSMAMADWEREVQAALPVHDRIESVDSIELEWDPDEMMVRLNRMDIITDDGDAVALLDVPITPEV